MTYKERLTNLTESKFKVGDKLSEKNENKYNEISDAQSKIRDITASEFKSKTMQKIFKSLETGKIKGQGVDAAVEIVKILLSSGVITKEDKLLFDKFIKFNYR